MATEKITSRAVSRIKRSLEDTGTNSAVYLWDTELKGFGCRVSPTGHVSWIFQHWVGGKRGKYNRVSFGKFPPTTVQEARKEAERLKGDVANGVDVSRLKKDRLSKQKQDLRTPSLEVLIELYVDEKSHGGRYGQEVHRILDTIVLPQLGPRTSITRITKDDIKQLVRSRKKLPGSARNLFATLRPFFAWCVEEDYLQVSPMADLTAPKQLKARARVLSDDEIKVFWTAAKLMGWPFGPFYKLLLLTGQRRDEVSGMCWSEVKGDTWTIPANRTKNGKDHIVHLSPLAQHVLSDETVRLSENTTFIFTTTTTTPISGYSKAKAKLDGYMENENPWRIHDLRRTAASGMARLGIEPHVIERVLNHTSGVTGGLVGVYQRYEYLEERKEALNAWARHLEALTN